jgi:hypothetical protein
LVQQFDEQQHDDEQPNDNLATNHHQVIKDRPVQGEPITCLSFGINRKDDWPLHHFCHNCRMYEQ